MGAPDELRTLSSCQRLLDIGIGHGHGAHNTQICASYGRCRQAQADAPIGGYLLSIFGKPRRGGGFLWGRWRCRGGMGGGQKTKKAARRGKTNGPGGAQRPRSESSRLMKT